MITQFQVDSFINQSYKHSILSQIPHQYSSASALLTLRLNIDLLKVFQTNRDIAILIVSKYPEFYSQTLDSIKKLMTKQNYEIPQYGIHLMVKINNCPLPHQDISSPEFLAAALQQKQGIMVYFPVVTVIQIGQPQVYLFGYTQIWSPGCKCFESQNRRKKKKVNRQLIQVVKKSQSLNPFHNRKQKILISQEQTFFCEFCQKAYRCEQICDQIYMNCECIKINMPKNLQNLHDFKYSSFSSEQLYLYVETKSKQQLKIGDLISCCCYIFCRPVPIKSTLQVGNQLIAKPNIKAYLISLNRYNQKDKKLKPLHMCSDNNKFFSNILNSTSLCIKQCKQLNQYQIILENFNNLVNQINYIKFPYLLQNSLTVFKLCILNSIFNLYTLGNNLCLLVIAQQIQIIMKAIQLNYLTFKFWPTDYDQATIKSWMISAKGSIVVLINPSKKDLKYLQKYLSKESSAVQNSLCITFWVFSEYPVKKDINYNYFAVVIDLTSEKNLHICKQVIDQTIDNRLSAFLTEDQQQIMLTIPKIQNKKARISLVDTCKKQSKIKQVDQQQQHQKAIQILQKYYLKCRQLKKTANISLTYLITIAEGFSMINRYLSKNNHNILHPKLSILDSVLAIFLDEESSRNKYSNANTIFGTDVSKLILNEKDCEISFWDFQCSEQGTLRQIKNYMSKDEMMKRMLYRLNQLLYDDQLLLLQDY